jgi:tartrate dehydrogenase/decarboxylase / D-malate dehydrogenase
MAATISATRISIKVKPASCARSVPRGDLDMARHPVDPYTGALRYPAFLTLFACLVLLFFLLHVIPQFAGLFSESGSDPGARHWSGRDRCRAVETSVFTRAGVERISRFGFDQARKRRGKLASVTKSNAQKYSMVFWDEVTRQVAADYPDVESTSYHVDALAARMVMAPESLDVVVASNLFGDILTDLGAAIQGGLGFAASANINPDRRVPSMFEPVHGSAPDIAHLGIASPIAAIWSGAMMLEHLGEADAAVRVMAALEANTARGIGTVPGKKRTEAITAAVLSRLS